MDSRCSPAAWIILWSRAIDRGRSEPSLSLAAWAIGLGDLQSVPSPACPRSRRRWIVAGSNGLGSCGRRVPRSFWGVDAMSRRLKRRGPGGRTRLDSTVGSRPMIQGRDSEPSPVARIPRVAVESGGRGVAGQTHVRRWPRTTRCNELAVIVMRDGEPEGRESLIAAVRRRKTGGRVGASPAR
jgi:hypothetical protein